MRCFRFLFNDNILLLLPRNDVPGAAFLPGSNGRSNWNWNENSRYIFEGTAVETAFLLLCLYICNFTRITYAFMLEVVIIDYFNLRLRKTVREMFENKEVVIMAMRQVLWCGYFASLALFYPRIIPHNI